MLKSEFSRIFALSVLIMAMVFGLSFFLFTTGFKPTYIVEQKLEKNAQFQIGPGIGLEYLHKYGNASETLVFLFGRKVAQSSNLSHFQYENCTLAVLQQSNLSTCINADGQDGPGNASIAQPFFFFSPWMLAASKSLDWSAKTVNSISQEPMESISVKFIKEEDFRGRNAFVFFVNETNVLGNASKTVWVDEKTRIVLKEVGENYSIELVKAQFPLLPQGE